jgi:hypothetical protein
LKKSGLVLHAKHAFMPNNLGYCGPDDRGRILQLLEGGSAGDSLLKTLKEFEAAYPFLTLIARSTGREAFDFAVPEAYWIGNSLLDQVPRADFYSFSHRELKGKDPGRVKELFKGVRGRAPPHHTFYVLSTYAGSNAADGPNVSNEKEAKVARLIDNCRISWARVREVGGRDMEVEHSPIVFDDGRLSLAKTVLKRVSYNPEIRPFQKVKAGDMVSVHWDYACDVLSTRQTRNLQRYTAADVALVNSLLASAGRRR